MGRSSTKALVPLCPLQVASMAAFIFSIPVFIFSISWRTVGHLWLEKPFGTILPGGGSTKHSPGQVLRKAGSIAMVLVSVLICAVTLET